MSNISSEEGAFCFLFEPLSASHAPSFLPYFITHAEMWWQIVAALTSPHGGTQRLQSVGKPPSPTVAIEARLLFVLRADDEVSGNSPVATNSTKHSTGEYPSL